MKNNWFDVHRNIQLYIFTRAPKHALKQFRNGQLLARCGEMNVLYIISERVISESNVESRLIVIVVIA